MLPGPPDFEGEWQGGRLWGAGRLRLLRVFLEFVGGRVAGCGAQGGYACCAFFWSLWVAGR